ncbi:hypothetical protein IJ670_02000 [bacterium]|nr:hypothetical protein [bacterium]
MGWVLLSLRKAELQRLHSQYQAEDLRISREERQMSRQYQYEPTLVRNEQQAELRQQRDAYNEQKSLYYDMMKDARAQDSGLTTGVDGSTMSSSDIYNLINDLQSEFQAEQNDTRSIYETDLQMLEEEANDRETDYENQKVTIETQMEAVAQELQAINQAISPEIQNSTIKLS